MSPTEASSTANTPASFDLSQGRNMLAIPGPSIMPDAVMAAMSRPVQNIYEGEVADLSWSLVGDLPKVVRTEGEAFTAIGNGHGAWEMAITNTLSAGDTVIVLDTGRFGITWGEFCGALGLDVRVIASPSPRHGFDPAPLADALAADTGHKVKAVMVCHVDTGSGIRADLAGIRAALDAAGHPALFFVDGMASVGCERYEMDALGVDVTIAASQKGLMAPPGLSFVWAGPKAIEAHSTAGLVTPYWSWTPRRSGGPHYLLFSGTPPVSHLYAMRVALDTLFAEGMEHVWHRHEVIANAVRAAVDAWSTPDGIGFQVLDVDARSNAVTGVETNGLDSVEFQRRCSDQANLTLGIGMGETGDRRFRIGHMGHLNPPMILGTLGTIESVLLSMGQPVDRSGVAAAAAVLGSALTQGSGRG